MAMAWLRIVMSAGSAIAHRAAALFFRNGERIISFPHTNASIPKVFMHPLRPREHGAVWSLGIDHLISCRMGQIRFAGRQ